MLKKTQAQARDRGLYSCLASNEAGEAQRNFSVEVLGTGSPELTQPCGLPPPSWGLPGGRGGRGCALLS